MMQMWQPLARLYHYPQWVFWRVYVVWGVIVALLRKLVPRVGVALMIWSADDAFMATKNENMPNVLWIWDMRNGLLHSVVGKGLQH